VVPCFMNSTISTPSLSQKTCVAISFLLGRCLFKLFQVLWWLCVHTQRWLLLGFSIHKWNTGFITCYSYDVTEKFITIFMVLLKKVKVEAIPYVLCALVSVFRTHLVQNLW
jgi:hypothetical protein